VKPTVNMPLKPLGPEGAEPSDPFRVGPPKGALSVGGGHQKRALAYGYSNLRIDPEKPPPKQNWRCDRRHRQARVVVAV